MSRSAQAGFTLAEFLVCTAIATVIVMSLATGMENWARIHRLGDLELSLQREGRLAADALKDGTAWGVRGLTQGWDFQVGDIGGGGSNLVRFRTHKDAADPTGPEMEALFWRDPDTGALMYDDENTEPVAVFEEVSFGELAVLQLVVCRFEIDAQERLSVELVFADDGGRFSWGFRGQDGALYIHEKRNGVP